MENWQNLPKNQEDAEKIEEAIDRLVNVHESDPDAHLGADESLNSHKASKVIDHIARSIVGDKINNIDTVLCHDHLSTIATIETVCKTKRLTFNHVPDDSFDITDRAAYFLTGSGAGQLLVPYGNGNIQLSDCEDTETWVNATTNTGAYAGEGASKRMDIPLSTTKVCTYNASPTFPLNLTNYMGKKLRMWFYFASAANRLATNGAKFIFTDNTGKKRYFNITAEALAPGYGYLERNMTDYTQDSGFNQANIVNLGVSIQTTAVGAAYMYVDDIQIVMDDSTKTSFLTRHVGALATNDELFFTKLKAHQPGGAPIWSKTNINAINGHSVEISDTDAYVEFTKECDRVEIYGSKGAWYGIVDIYIDGVFDSTVDLYQDMVDSMLPVFEKVFETTAVRTFKIVVTGDSNPSSNGSGFILSGIDTNGIIDISSIRLLKMTTYHYFGFDVVEDQTVEVVPPAGYEVYAPTGTRALAKIDSMGQAMICDQYVEGGSGWVRVETANAGEEVEGEAHWLIVKNDNIWENTSE